MNYGLADSASGRSAGSSSPQPGALRSQVVMNGQPLHQTVTIRDPQGLHMRPAAAFAKAARQFRSTVTLRLHDRAVNGKSQLDLMLLAAEPGSELILEVDGDDAADALASLADLLQAVAVDDDDAGPPLKG